MSDKPRTQQQLARDLADLVDVLHPQSNVMGFIEAFWLTMAREWGSIDALRMDKYLYLVRCYVRKGFEVCAKDGWRDEEVLERYLEILGAVPFNARDGRIANGLRFHVLDLFVDELEEVDGERSAPVERILAPVRRLGRETITRSVRMRVQEALRDERLVDWQGVIPAEEDGTAEEVEVVAGGDDEEFGGFED